MQNKNIQYVIIPVMIIVFVFLGMLIFNFSGITNIVSNDFYTYINQDTQQGVVAGEYVVRMSAVGPIFSFVQITDLHFGGYDGSDHARKDGLKNKINSLSPKPDLILATGDIATTPTAAEYDEFKASMNSIGIPYYPIPGNHNDVLNKTLYKQKLGDDKINYYFDHKGVRFIMLTHYTVTPNWSDVESWIKNAPGKVIVADHYALRKPRTAGRAASYYLSNSTLNNLLKNNSDKVVAYLSGHSHVNDYTTSGGVHHVNTQSLVTKNCGFREYVVYQDKIEVKLQEVGCPNGGYQWTDATDIDADHPDRKSYNEGNPDERNFTMNFDGTIDLPDCNGYTCSATQICSNWLDQSNLCCSVACEDSGGGGNGNNGGGGGSNVNYQIGWANSMTKVFLRNDVESFGNWNTNANISLAKNEYESMQVVIKPEANMQNVKVTAEGFGDLKVEINPVGSVNITQKYTGAYNVEGNTPLGWYPDPILTFTEGIDIKANDQQAFWVTVYAPKGMAAGTYTGTLKVEPGVKEVSLQVRVYDFTIPDKPSLETAWSWGGINNMDEIYPGTETWSERQSLPRNTYKEEMKMLIEKYRFWPDRIYTYKIPYMTELFNEYGFTAKTQLKAAAIHLEANCLPKNYSDMDTYVNDYVNDLKQRWGELSTEEQKNYYIYMLDEQEMADNINKVDCYDEAKEMVGKIYNQVPNIPILMCSYRSEIPAKRDTEFAGYITGIARDNMNPNDVAFFKSQGVEVWPYTTGYWQKNINWVIESPLLNSRVLLGPSAYKLDFDGFLYYQVARFTYNNSNTKPIYITDGAYIHGWDSFISHGNGVDIWFYPGPLRLTPSIRLANVRDGLEDYEYYKIAECLTGSKISVPSDVTGSQWYERTGSISKVYSQREKIAQLIESQGGNANNCKGEFAKSGFDGNLTYNDDYSGSGGGGGGTDPYCGDGYCLGNETEANCPSDCTSDGGGNGGGGDGGNGNQQPTGPIAADFNNDKEVNIQDFGILLSNWHKRGDEIKNKRIDLVKDDFIDIKDLSKLLSCWGKPTNLGCFDLGTGFDEGLRAFPGAHGYGSETVGGRGGQVIEVTNLNDSGPGSLRAAVETPGPRIVVFRVGGTIELKSRLTIIEPYITIAGQTAPGDGITIKAKSETEIRNTHDVIIRYIRFRGVENRNQDCLNIVYGSYNVVIDHCSLSWCTDESLSVVAKSHDVTLQWNIISEPIGFTDDNGTYHSGKGSLITGVYDVSAHHNLYAHSSERNAKMMGVSKDLDGNLAYFDFVNNVVYNWGGYAHSVAGSGKCNVIANYFKPGQNSGSYPRRREVMRWQFEEGRLLYVTDNIGPSCPQGCEDDWIGGTFTWKGQEYTGGMVSDISGNLGEYTKSESPIPAPPVATYPAETAYQMVLEKAGASIPKRDSVDERIINDVKNGTGKIINHVSEISGWPTLSSGTPPVDTDHDGMPDSWEDSNGLDKNDPSDNSLDKDGDGYTNIEEYLNSLVN